MKEIILDYSKVTRDILDLFVENYPLGYEYKDILSIKNANNEYIKVIEVFSSMATYYLEVSSQLDKKIDEILQFNSDRDDILENKTLVKRIDTLIEKNMGSTFHLSLPCLKIEETKHFYMNLLGANSGRETENWMDINLFGNQLTFTKSGKFDFTYKNYKFEGKILPSFHFGVILEKSKWNKLYDKIKLADGIYMDRATFLVGRNGEHYSFFVKDPNGYVVEFKCFKHDDSIFSF